MTGRVDTAEGRRLQAGASRTLAQRARADETVSLTKGDANFLAWLGENADALLAAAEERDTLRRDLAEEQARTTRLTEFVRRARPLLGMSISNSLGAQADKLLAECGAGTEQPA